LIGQVISDYRTVAKVGGGMGVVYKAEDTTLGRFVALKFLPQELVREGQALERFQREAQAASSLDCTRDRAGNGAGEPVSGRSVFYPLNEAGRCAQGSLRSSSSLTSL